MGINPAMITSKKFTVDPTQGAKGRHAKNIFARLAYPFIILIVGVFVEWFAYAVFFQVFSVFLVLTIVVAAYVGWQSLSEYQIFSAIPIAKIEGAAYGLSEIAANFVPESGAPLPMPLGDGKCAYYNLELHYRTSGKNSHDYVEWSHQDGVPSLLYDTTGYLYADYTKAEFGFYVNTYYIRDKKWLDMNFKNEVFAALNASCTPGKKFDITPFSSSITLGVPSTRILFDSFGSEPSPTGYYLRLTYLPTDSQYFIISNISDSGKRYNGKVVKLASVDPKSSIFSIVPEPKTKVIAKLRNYAIINFVLAALCLVVLILFINQSLL